MAPGYGIQPWALKKEQIERSDLFKSIMGSVYATVHALATQTSVTCGRVQHKRKDPAKSLNKDQCNAALEIFSNYQLATRNLEIIWPVLPEVLQSVILGMLEVEHYFSYTSQKLELPKEIIGQRYIYLRRCPKDAS